MRTNLKFHTEPTKLLNFLHIGGQVYPAFQIKSFFRRTGSSIGFTTLDAYGANVGGELTVPVDQVCFENMCVDDWIVVAPYTVEQLFTNVNFHKHFKLHSLTVDTMTNKPTTPDQPAVIGTTMTDATSYYPRVYASTDYVIYLTKETAKLPKYLHDGEIVTAFQILSVYVCGQEKCRFRTMGECGTVVDVSVKELGTKFFKFNSIKMGDWLVIDSNHKVTFVVSERFDDAFTQYLNGN